MYHIFFFHSSVGGHLSCFHVLAADSAAVNIRVPVFFQKKHLLNACFVLVKSWVLGMLSKTSHSFKELTHKGEGHSDSDFSTAGKRGSGGKSRSKVRLKSNSSV